MSLETLKPPPCDPDALRGKYLEKRDKRLRSDGAGQYIEATGEFDSFIDDPYVGPAPPCDAFLEEVDVAVIGGGFGGTWYWNRSPGVRCDIEAYIYLPLIEEVGTIPRERYAAGSKIFAHCQAIGRHYRLYDRALFQAKATRIAWDDAATRCIVETDRGDAVRARFVTVSQGPLAKVKLPSIPASGASRANSSIPAAGTTPTPAGIRRAD